MKKLSYAIPLFLFSLSALANTVYVTDRSSNEVYAIDTEMNAVTAVVTNNTMQSISVPTGIGITPNGLVAYVAAEQSNGTVFVVDTTTNEANSEVIDSDLFVSPSGIGIAPNGLVVYVADYNAPGVFAVDTTNNTVTASVDTDVFPAFSIPVFVRVTPNGSQAYALDQGGDPTRIYVINTGNNKVTSLVSGSFTAFDSFSEVAFTPDGSVAYVTEQVNQQVFVVDVATHTVTQTVTNMIRDFVSTIGVAVAPNGLFAYVADASGFVYIVDTLTNTVTTEVTNASGTPFVTPTEVVFTPDGTTAYLTDTGSSSVYVIDVATHTATAVVSNSFTAFQQPYGLAITPDPIPVIVVYPPQNLTGRQKKNDFGLVFELYNLLKWEAPTSSANVVGYNVYRDGTKIATLGSSTFEYEDHNRKKGVTTLYAVTSFNGDGDESTPVSVTVN